MADNRVITLSFNGRDVLAAPLTGSQMTALMMSKAAGNEAKTLTRFMRVIETRVGPDEWELMDEDMVMGTVEMTDFTDFLRNLADATVKLTRSQNETAEISPPTEDPVVDDEIEKAEAFLANLRAERESKAIL